ncbi:DUF885 family protein, partial [bacterium]|nr:DUF885 family protein [bacterium]
MKKILFIILLATTSCASWTLQNESDRLNDFFEAEFEKNLALYPEVYTYLGIKKKYDQLNNYTEAFALENHEDNKKTLIELQKFNVAELNESSKLSYQLFKKKLEDEIADFEWRYHSYVTTQFFGFHSDLPAFMMNFHQVENEDDLQAYVARLRELKRVIVE